MIEYLGRYTHKIAISNYRIRQIDKEKRTVTFSLKDCRKSGVKTTQTMSSKEFIRRFALHILPKGFTRIRHYEILSSTWKKEKIPTLQGKLRDKNSVKNTGDSKEMTKTATMLHQCPCCKVGTLKTVLVFDKRGPPENYKEIIISTS